MTTDVQYWACLPEGKSVGPLSVFLRSNVLTFLLNSNIDFINGFWILNCNSVVFSQLPKSTCTDF